ncbi:MAG: exosortase system-associated protein, TIGR04073 family [Blastochloris sp.]|nr:exosortase system-associated protein, TIGR04073 family [Blastochloris sp.]
MKSITTIALFALTLVLAPLAQADLTMPKKSNFYDKLGRGLANIVLAPAHVLDSTYELTMNEGPTIGATKGFVQGTSRMIMDMFVGIAEVVTSPIPSESYKSPAYDSGLVEPYPPADLIDNWY